MPRGSSKSEDKRQTNGKLGAYMPSGAGGSNGTNSGALLEWAEIPATLIYAVTVAVDRSGGAVLFGSSRDRTQFAVTLFFDGQKNTWYWYRNDVGIEQICLWFEGLVQDLTNGEGV